MEKIIRKQPCLATSTPSALAMHKDSRTISKAKPKIRIIHIFAPEIIKTDVANFRELVQRLTGKPTEKSCKKKSRMTSISSDHQDPRAVKPVTKKSGFFGLESTRERVKEEDDDEMWHGENSSGLIFNGFADFDGFIKELGEFPLLPMDATHSHIHAAFEETQFA